MSTLHVHDAAREAPERDALVIRGEAHTYNELRDRLDRVLEEILEEGWLPGSHDPYPLVARLDEPTLLHLLALITAGIPVHLIHPALTETERAALMADLDDLELHERPNPADDPPLARGNLNFPDVDARDEHPLAIVYTSGTGGRPKGVVLSRRAFVWSARASAANLGWRDDDRWLLRIPAAHIGGLSTVTRCLLARRCLVLADDRVGLLEQIERDRVTIASIVPTQLRRIIDEAPEWRAPAHLRAILLGGGYTPPELLTDAADRGWPVLTTYGLTETCSQVATQPYGTVNRGELGAGRPLKGVELRIVDDVIQVRGRMLFSGYVGGGEPLLTADGWLVTGDRGRLDEDGCLHVTGRASDLIVTGGENVDPLEVEAALRDLPGVADACVFALADREWGERVAAVIVPSGDRPDLAAIDRALRGRLASFKRPRALAFAEALPLTLSGKVDRRATARAFSDRLTPLNHEE